MIILVYININLIINFIYRYKMPKDLRDNIKTFLLYLRGDDKSGVKPIASSIFDNITIQALP